MIGLEIELKFYVLGRDASTRPRVCTMSHQTSFWMGHRQPDSNDWMWPGSPSSRCRERVSVNGHTQKTSQCKNIEPSPHPVTLYRSLFPNISLASFHGPAGQWTGSPWSSLWCWKAAHVGDEKRTLVSTLGAGRLFLLSLFTDKRHELVVERRASGRTNACTGRWGTWQSIQSTNSPSIVLCYLVFSPLSDCQQPFLVINNTSSTIMIVHIPNKGRIRVLSHGSRPQMNAITTGWTMAIFIHYLW